MSQAIPKISAQDAKRCKYCRVCSHPRHRRTRRRPSGGHMALLKRVVNTGPSFNSVLPNVFKKKTEKQTHQFCTKSRIHPKKPVVLADGIPRCLGRLFGTTHCLLCFTLQVSDDIYRRGETYQHHLEAWKGMLPQIWNCYSKNPSTVRLFTPNRKPH